MTTITKRGTRLSDNITYSFQPASAYAYIVGANIIRGKHTSMPDVEDEGEVTPMI